MGTGANENWDKWALTLTAIGEMGTWENEHEGKDISTEANKYLFAQVLTCSKCPFAPMRISHEFICSGARFPNCPFVRSAQLPYGPAAYFTRIILLQLPIRDGAHFTSAQLLICPKCPSPTPLEAATANITTQSCQRIGLRI